MAPALRRLASISPRRFPTFWLIAGVNAVLIAFYLWSRGGATTEVRIEATGTRYEAYVDGKLIFDGELKGRPNGGIGFRLRRLNRIPSLPRPRGIDWVRVTDAETDEILFEDDFSGSRSARWKIGWGDWEVEDGVLTTATGGMTSTGSSSWKDYVLEVRLRNVEDANIYLRMKDRDDLVELSIQPFRYYGSSLRLLQDGKAAEARRGNKLELDRSETVRSIVAMLLRPYPTVLLMVAGVAALALLLRWGWLERRALAMGRPVLDSATPLIFLLAVWAFILLWYLNYVVGEHMPHVPDSVAYVFQAKIFASFRVTAEPPPVPGSFSFFNPPFLHVVDGRWFSQYPFGHPLFLSVGELVGAVWLVPPALGAASLMLIYWVGKHVYGTMVGLLAAVLLLFSPFFQMTASNFMSHNTAVFVILACLFLLVRPTKRRLLSMFFSGVFLGLLFNMRPLVAVAFMPALGVLLGYELLRAKGERVKLFREDLAFAAGAALLLLLYFLYNQATTGSFTRSPQVLTFGDASEWVGFGGSHSLAKGLQNERQLFALMLLVANGWPMAIGLAFAVLPFLLGSRKRWDYFLGASALSLAGVNVFYTNAAVMHGPRFWYETMPFLMLLTARGAQCLRDAGSAAGDWLAARLRGGPPMSTTAVTGFAVISLVIGLVAFSTYGWMLERRDAWAGVPFVPQKISMLEGFNFTDRRLLDRADKMDLQNALVLVERCANWWCFGSVFWTNSPNLDGNVVWAERQNNQDDIKLLNYYQGRKLYLADYDEGTIRSVTREEIIASARKKEATEAQRRSRDQTRREDLERLLAALEQYRQETGGYPNTEERVQSLCVYPEQDAGCALTRVLPKLPADPLGAPTTNGYWYASDGTYFILVAQQEVMPDPRHRCPDRIVRIVGERADYCLQGRVP